MGLFMIAITFLIICIIRLIFDNAIIYSGAYKGLMLWYTRIVPLLLPFLILSSVLTEKVQKYINSKNSKENSSLLPIFISILLGTICGCPIGARTINHFYNSQKLSFKEANLLLPLCNNISPIFLAGYIHNYILHSSISFYKVILFIYIPYLIYGILIMFQIIKKQENTSISNHKLQIQSTTDLALSSIIQITYIGLYIMLCSIIIEFLIYYKPFRSFFNVVLCGMTEITTGSMLVANYNISPKIKTALILSITSWGGFCTLLQTKKAINKSRLSMIYYAIVKFICALCTYELTILIL